MANIWDLVEATEEVGGDLESLEYWEIRGSRNSTNRRDDATYEFNINDTKAGILYSSSYLHHS